MRTITSSMTLVKAPGIRQSHWPTMKSTTIIPCKPNLWYLDVRMTREERQSIGAFKGSKEYQCLIFL